MAALTWIGGGNNKASNPQDWSPTGAPVPGDTLQVAGSGNIYTINVRGDALAGNLVRISDASVTMNLSHDAAVNASFGNAVEAPLPNTATFNLGRGVSDLNLSASLEPESLSVNLARDAIWVGTFNLVMAGARLVTTAGEHALFINDGASSTIKDIGAVLAMPVAGTGSIAVAQSDLEFQSSVGANQSVSVYSDAPYSVITIDHPKEYHASTSIGTGGELDLVGLAHADSYSYQNDMLRIYAGDTVIDRMKLQLGYGAGSFAVTQAVDGVHIYGVAVGDGPPAGGLPLHSAV
jgi:hypothetical protein